MQNKILKENKKSGFTPQLNFLKKGNLVRGFTLVEIMVATAIFTVVMLIGMGSLIMVSGSAKKAKALNFTMDNLNFAMESMTRSLRMGMDYYCSGKEIDMNNYGIGSRDCPGGAYKVAFKPSTKFSSGANNLLAYWIKRKDDGNYTIVRCSGGSSSCTSIISDSINIDSSSRFYVKGAEVVGVQPSVYMTISGSVNIKGEAIPFAIQTMVSQRTLEN